MFLTQVGVGLPANVCLSVIWPWPWASEANLKCVGGGGAW